MPPRKRKYAISSCTQVDDLVNLNDETLKKGTKCEREVQPPRYWCFKSEGRDRYVNGVNVKFTIDDLQRVSLEGCNIPNPTTNDTPGEEWSGVRNYAARNFMMQMKCGDLGFFYHSNVPQPGIVGICEISEEASPDMSAFDPTSVYYDVKSTRDKPRWYCVKVRFRQKFPECIPLSTLRAEALNNGPLCKMMVASMRRPPSVSPVSPDEWSFIMKIVNKNIVSPPNAQISLSPE